MSGDNDNVLVELRPFKHQVGGHTCVLELNRSTICKPHVEREAWFYIHAPEQFKEFTPKYRGEVEVTCDVSGDNMCLIARLPKAVADDQGLVTFTPPIPFASNPTDATARFRQKRKREELVDSDGKQSHNTEAEIHNSCSRSSEIDTDTELWSIQCIKRQISRHGFWANNQPQKFIMLENLVHTYRRPCLLDLKMGRRQYGDDSSAEKRKMMEARCRQSTSCSLGFRICGTQVFQENTESYITHDKYHGRHLDADGVKEELSHYFHNGVNLRKDAVYAIIAKLQKLKCFLQTQSEFKLYSCSLLLMYDGCAGENAGTCSSHSNTYTSPLPSNVYTSRATKTPPECSDANNESECDNLYSENITGLCSTCVHPRVDVRLIDFAHASSDDNEIRNSDVNFNSSQTNCPDADDVDMRTDDSSVKNIRNPKQHCSADNECMSECTVCANAGIIFGLDNLSSVLQGFL